MTRDEVFRWEFDIPVRREVLWGFVADTERINRLAGLFPVHYTYEPRESGGAEVHASARAAGLTLRWIERPCEWAEPEFFRFTRDYDAGPFRRLISEVVLADGPTAGSTHLVHTITVAPRGPLGRLLARYSVGVQIRRGLARAYAMAPRWAEGQGPPLADAGPREEVRRALDRVLRPLAAELGCEAEGEHLRRALLTDDEEALASIGPYALADRGGVDRRRTLTLLLHATRAGLFDLEYDLICPSCRRSKASAGRLAELREDGHCPSCNIRFGVDFERSIEVRFAPRPLGLGLDATEYCHAGPRNTPHRIAGWSLDPGESREVEFTGATGAHQLLSPQTGSVYVELVDDPEAPAEAALLLGAAGIEGVPGRLRAGRVRLRARSELAIPGELMVARSAWADDAVTAAELATIQDFRDLFGADILAPGAEFAIESQVFLFTDIVGSTALYEEIGDATAFALVREHFDRMKDAYAARGGALVKTIGDAIMAVFRRPDDALRAAIDMQRRLPAVRDPRRGVGLHMRIGLHRGPCIAMTANERIDYFGTTVNTAARVQGVAGADEIALTPALLDAPEVRAILAAERLPARTEMLALKGLRGTHAITVVQVAPTPS